MAEYGSYGIKTVKPNTPGAFTCGECGRSWMEETPSGRCPFEDVHETEDSEEYTIADVFESIRDFLKNARAEEDRNGSLTAPASPEEMYWRGARIAYENALGEIRSMIGEY